MSLIVLESERARVTVDPVAGGRVASCVVDGHEILVDRDAEALAWGAYPMVPFAGRIDAGRFRFAGRDIELPQTLGGHAIHGYGYASQWERLDDEATAPGVTSPVVGFEFASPWPFEGSARQVFRLDDRSLTCVLEVRSRDDQPVSVGWHPWFRRTLTDGSELELAVEPERMYELDAMIPTGRLVPPTPRPWDNCFVELARDPLLRWGSTLAVTISSSCNHWVVYDEPDHAICVEPQSAAPDEVNRDPLVVVAGDRLVHSMTWTWG